MHAHESMNAFGLPEMGIPFTERSNDEHQKGYSRRSNIKFSTLGKVTKFSNP